MANLLSGGIRESCVLIGYPSRQDGTSLPARDFPLRSRKKNNYSLFRRIINSLLTKFVRSRWLDTGLVLFYVFIDLNAEKELGQYTAIFTWRLVNKAYVLCFEGRVFKKVFKEVQWIVLHKSKREQGNSCRNPIVSAYETVVPCKSAFKGSKKR